MLGRNLQDKNSNIVKEGTEAGSASCLLLPANWLISDKLTLTKSKAAFTMTTTIERENNVLRPSTRLDFTHLYASLRDFNSFQEFLRQSSIDPPPSRSHRIVIWSPLIEPPDLLTLNSRTEQPSPCPAVSHSCITGSVSTAI